MTTTTHWKPIITHPNYCINCLGQIKNNKTNKPVIPKLNSKGYSVVKLKISQQQQQQQQPNLYKYYKVDQFVAKAFIENPQKFLHIKHKNGVLNDNRVSNIEWTHSKPMTTMTTMTNTFIYPKIKHYVKYMIRGNETKKKLYYKTEQKALEMIKTIQLTNPEYKCKVQKKRYYLTEITYNEKKFYKKHHDYLLVHRLHRQMYLVIKYCNLFLKLLKKNKKK